MKCVACYISFSKKNYFSSEDAENFSIKIYIFRFFSLTFKNLCYAPIKFQKYFQKVTTLMENAKWPNCPHASYREKNNFIINSYHFKGHFLYKFYEIDGTVIEPCEGKLSASIWNFEGIWHRFLKFKRKE